MKQKQDERLGTEKLGKLILGMALPQLAAQIINVLYNIVDRIYIGHIEDYGQLALTGVGVTFPILMIISAFSSLAGAGGAPLASMKLGRKDYEGASKILGNSTSLLITFSAILTVFFMIFKKPILYAFGASDNTIVYANDYITIYLIGTIFVQLSLGLNAYISAQGFAKTAMLSVVIGAVTNIILDPIFIFGCNLGVKGAALATIISQATSAAWVVRFLTSQKSVIRIERRNMRLEKTIVFLIASIGISPFIMQSTESLVSITLNSGLQKYGGDIYVGTMSIMLSIMQIIVVPIQGFSQGAQPIMSYNYGAEKYERVAGTFKRLLAICLGSSLIMAGAAVCMPQMFASVFTQDRALVDLTVQVMPIYFAGITIFGIQMACQGLFLATGQAKISLVIAILRKLVLLVPLALILPRFFGVMGVYYAEPIADVASVTITIILFLSSYRKIFKKSKSVS